MKIICENITYTDLIQTAATFNNLGVAGIKYGSLEKANKNFKFAISILRILNEYDHNSYNCYNSNVPTKYVNDIKTKQADAYEDWKDLLHSQTPYPSSSSLKSVEFSFSHAFDAKKICETVENNSSLTTVYIQTCDLLRKRLNDEEMQKYIRTMLYAIIMYNMGISISLKKINNSNNDCYDYSSSSSLQLDDVANHSVTTNTYEDSTTSNMPSSSSMNCLHHPFDLSQPIRGVGDDEEIEESLNVSSHAIKSTSSISVATYKKSQLLFDKALKMFSSIKKRKNNCSGDLKSNSYLGGSSSSSYYHHHHDLNEKRNILSFTMLILSAHIYLAKERQENDAMKAFQCMLNHSKAKLDRL